MHFFPTRNKSHLILVRFTSLIWIPLQRTSTPTWTRRAQSLHLRPQRWAQTDPGPDPRSSSVTLQQRLSQTPLRHPELSPSSCRTSAAVRSGFTFLWFKLHTLLFKGFYLKESNIFVQQGCIKLIKIGSKENYKVVKCCSFELSIHQRIMKNKYTTVSPQKYEAAQLFSTLIKIKSVSWAANQNDFWRVMWQKIQLCITGINYILQYIQIEKRYFKL